MRPSRGRLPSRGTLARSLFLTPWLALGHAAILLPAPARAVESPSSAPKATDKVGPDGKIVLQNPPDLDAVADQLEVTSRCYLDVNIGNRDSTDRIVIDLYGRVCPRAAENFRLLCTGEKGFGYAGSRFHRIVSGLTLQGGEIKSSDGSLGRAALGQTFEHDNMSIKHNTAGLVSMSNSAVGGGGSTSDSRFIIQLPNDASFLDGRYEAFGRVSEGMDIVNSIAKVPVTGTKNSPIVAINIVSAGEL